MKQNNPKPPRRTVTKSVKPVTPPITGKSSAAPRPSSAATKAPASKPAPPAPGKTAAPKRAVQPPEALKPKSATPSAAPAKAAPAAPQKPVIAPAPAAPPAPARKPAKAAAPLNVPPILLEGDRPSKAASAGPGRRYALGPTPPPPHAAPVEADLPEAFGTGQLFLTARDPRWLYAAWDLTNEQLRHYNGLSIDRHLILRLYRDAISDPPLTEIHVHPESRNWFAPAPFAGAKYLAEIGFYAQPGQWTGISTSGATLTPPDTLAEDAPVRFASFEPDMPLPELVKIVQSAIRQSGPSAPLVEALEQLRAEGFVGLPSAVQAVQREWTPAQEQALAQVLSVDMVRRVWVGSLEITELVRRQLRQQVSSMELAGSGSGSVSAAGLSSLSSLSSPYGGAGERRKGFWFNVNAELIIYGATEPDARVAIGGRPIKLRPDGSFSFRFTLPDGQYSLPATAVNAAGDDSRSAALHFSRATEYTGHVEAHPQDPALKAPTPDATA